MLRTIFLRAAVLAIATLGLVGCGDDKHSPGLDDQSTHPPVPAACSTPAEGCPCNGNDTAKCGETVSRKGDVVTCRDGERSCVDGAWGECVTGSSTSEIYSPAPKAPGVSAQNLATGAVTCMEACDPYCQVLADTPGDLNAGMNFDTDNTGLTLHSSGFTGGNCPDVNITPADSTLEITTINTDGTVVPSTVALTAACGLAATAITPSWSVSETDRSVVGADGMLRVFSGVAGDLDVTAASTLDTGAAVVHVKVNINEATGISAAIKTQFDGAGTTMETGKVLYPYKNTIFPLDLKAPLVQWQTGGTAAANVQVALRYPAGAAMPTFWYSKIFAGEPNDGTIQTTGAPSWAIPQAVWTAFARTALGANAEIIIQRRTNATLYKELVIPIKFSSTALRGTVYYTQYLRRLKGSPAPVCSGQTDLPNSFDPLNPGGQICPVGNCTHSSTSGGSTVRAIDLSNPAATNSDPFNSKGCPVCHSVSAQGNVFVSGSRFLEVWGTASPKGFVDDIGLSGGVPTFTSKGEAPNYSSLATVGSDWNSRGFAFAPLTPDGGLALQGPYWWGNSQLGNVSDNLTQNKNYQLGGQNVPMFFLPTTNSGANVQFATTTALTATRVGSVLAGAGALPTIDGMTLAVNDSLLVKNQANGVDNGIYTVTGLGASGMSNQDFTLSTTLTTTASSVSTANPGNTAGKAFDNLATTTRWESQASDPQWLKVDLGASKVITRVYMDWQTANAKNYIVEVSPDNATWTTVANKTNMAVFGDHRPDDLTGFSITGRYVRVTGTARNTAGGYSIWEMDVYGDTGTPYQLTRRDDANGVTPTTSNAGNILKNWEVRVTRGTANYSHVFKLTAPTTDPVINTDSLTFTDLNASVLPTMTMPAISPDGTKVAYVNADSDTIGADSTAWRKGLTMLSFDAGTRTVSNKKRLVNNWAPAPGNGGTPIKWPFFEHDSRSVVFVQTDPDEYCRSGSDTATNAGRACFGDGANFANAAPTQRGYWAGRLFSIDSGAATPSTTKAELAILNNAEDASDAGKAFQPTVLPFSSGGYRWVIFTSPRSYGNQINQIGTNFTCGATLLWVAALDDAQATATDRSHPAFLLPGQQILPISTQDHYVNERGYLVPSLCKANDTVCTNTDECCGTSKCAVDSIPATGAPIKKCKDVNACSAADGPCLTNADCCGMGASCVAQKCVAQPNYMASGTFTRDYVAQCDPGFKPRWGLFQYHATTPLDSSLSFSALTSDTSAGLATATAVGLGTSTVDNYGGTAAAIDVGAALEAKPVSPFLSYLRVSMTFFPSTNKVAAPILHDWAQRYSCLPAE